MKKIIRRCLLMFTIMCVMLFSGVVISHAEGKNDNIITRNQELSTTQSDLIVPNERMEVKVEHSDNHEVSSDQPEGSYAEDTENEDRILSYATEEDTVTPRAEVAPLAVSGEGLALEVIPTSEKTAYSAIDNITSHVNLDGMNLKEAIYNPYLEITLPADVRTNADLVTKQFLDLFQTATEGIPLVKGVTTTSNTGSTTIRINFSKIDATTRLRLPYVFSFTDRLTPNDFTMQPVVKLFNAKGELIQEKKDQTYSVIYPERTLDKKVLGLNQGAGQDDQLVYAGSAKTGDANRIRDTLMEYIPFFFNISYKRWESRMIQTAEIRDTLPTYVNSKGETVTALFNAALNPGWKDNGDGTVSYVSEFIQDDLKQMEDINVKVQQIVLRLAFPDAALKVNEKNEAYYNKADIYLTPFNPGKNEIYHYEDQLRFFLTASPNDGSGMLKQKSARSLCKS